MLVRIILVLGLAQKEMRWHHNGLHYCLGRIPVAGAAAAAVQRTDYCGPYFT